MYADCYLDQGNLDSQLERSTADTESESAKMTQDPIISIERNSRANNYSSFIGQKDIMIRSSTNLGFASAAPIPNIVGDIVNKNGDARRPADNFERSGENNS